MLCCSLEQRREAWYERYMTKSDKRNLKHALHA